MHLRIKILSLIISLPVFLTAQVNADFAADVHEGCSPLVVNFDNLSSGASGYFWDFGNGNTSVMEDPSAVYLLPGTYTVKLIASDGINSDSIIESALIEVFPDPVADFSFGLAGNCAGSNLLTTTDASIGAADYLWDFGDGNTSTATSPTHVYTTPGTHNLVLVVTSVEGCTDLKVESGAVTIDPTPNMNVMVDTNSWCGTGHVFNFQGIGPMVSTWEWYFGDGNSLNLQNPSHAYSTPGVYQVMVVGTTAAGCVDTTYLPGNIHVKAAPDPSFTTNVLSGCEPVNVNFQAAGAPLASATWDFGDGNTAMGASESHSYSSVGSYDVTLYVTSPNGCQDSLQGATIEVYPPITAGFTMSDTIGCTPLSVNFNATTTSTFSPVYTWDLGDGNTATGATPTHNYMDEGTFNPELTVTDANGCEVIVQMGQVETQTTDLEIEASAFEGCAPFDVSMWCTNPDITTWHWDFGDGNTGSGQTVNHQYATIGQYTITLITENIYGCTDTLILDDHFDVFNADIQFNVPDTLMGCSPYEVQFTGSGIGTGTWYWDFGDGTTSTDPDPAHVYSTSGTYTVSLMSYTTGGCQFEISEFANVVIDTAMLDLSYTTSCTSDSVWFDISPTNAVEWHWTFGDGNTSTAQGPAHEYNGANTYLVTVSITTEYGCTASAMLPVTTGCPVGGAGGGMPGSGAGGTIIDYALTNPGQVNCIPVSTSWTSPYPGHVSHHWDFGDGGTSNAMHPTYTYTTTGTFDIVHTAMDTAGNTDTITIINYSTMGDVTASFSNIQNNGCGTATVNYFDSSVNAVKWDWDFGDGDTDTLASPTHQYLLDNNIYFTTLRVSDLAGCAANASTTILASEFPVTFNYDSTVCDGDSVHFFPVINEPYAALLWDFGDGYTSTDLDPIHYYTNEGTYSITLELTDLLGCSRVIDLPYEVRMISPNAGFQALDPIEVCPGDWIGFEADDLTQDTYNWTMGTWTATGPTAGHEFVTGYYDITLEVSKDGCTAIDHRPQMVLAHYPTATYAFDIIDNCYPATVEFDGTGSSAGTFVWSFGNGDSAFVEDPIYDFITPPNDTITMTFTDSWGCVRQREFTIDIPTIHAAYGFSDTVGCAPFEVSFSDQSFAAASWHWDFGDGATSTIQDPVHTYMTGGVFEVRLIVESATGCMDTTVMATIHVGEPMAAMSFASSGTCAPAVVDFTNGSTGAIDFTWDFGDGMESNMIDPTHVYTEPGIYFTQLTVTDELGCQDSITAIDTIIVQGPVVDFLWMDSLACEHLEVAFSNQTIDGVTYEWHFGDGATSTLEDPTHLYTDPGVYDVTLIATDANGCSSSNSYTGIIEIFENPAISATFSDTMGCGPLTVSMTALGTGVAATSWDLGDGSTSTQDSLSHTYTTSGNYVIEIVGTTMNGCSDTLQQLIVVEQNFDASIDPAGPYCSTQVSDTLTAANAGGSWSGTGISAAGVFDPIAAGVGNHTITYTISGACGAMDSIEIVVNQGFSAQIDMVLPICSNVAPFQMTAADAGGTWSGIGVDPTTGLFDPAAAGAGSHTITYTISGICGDSDDFILDVLATPVADFNVNITSLCAPSMVDLNNQSTMAGNYEWYMDGSFVSASENPSLMVNPGVYDIMLVASNPWGCTDTAFVAGAIDLQDAGPLPSPEMVVTTVINNEVVYTKWSDTLAGHPNLNEYWLFRSEDQVNYDLVTTMSSSQHDYYDYDVDVMNQNYTYYVLAVNHCEVASEQGNISSSILLEGVQIDELTDRLYWTPYTEWEDGVDRYEIQILLENGVWETIEVVDGNTTFVDIQ